MGYIVAREISMFRLLFIFISFVFYSSVGFSQTLEIDMLNKLGKEKMLYSVKVAKIDVNQKIIWRSKTKGHNVEFIGMPEVVKKFKSKINKDVEYEFKVPGIYLYQCTPHKGLGMIALVVVGGDTSNKDDIANAKTFGKSKKILPDLINQL